MTTVHRNPPPAPKAPPALSEHELEPGKLYEVVEPRGARGGIVLAYRIPGIGRSVGALMLMRGPCSIGNGPLPSVVMNSLCSYVPAKNDVYITIQNDGAGCTCT